MRIFFIPFQRSSQGELNATIASKRFYMPVDNFVLLQMESCNKCFITLVVVTEYAFQITGPSVIDECYRDTGGGRGPEKTPH